MEADAASHDANNVASPQDTTSAEPPSSRMVQLANTISKKTAFLDAYFRNRDVPVPSFEWDSPTQLPIAANDHDARKVQQELVMATEELKALATGGEDWVRYMAWQSTDMLALQGINSFGFAEAFAPGTTTTYAALANATKLPESTVRRFVRYAVRRYIFTEPVKNVVAHTSASVALAQNPRLRAWVAMQCGDLWPAFARTVEAVEKWPDSEEINSTGISLANETEEPFFAIFAKDQKRLARYVLAMSSWAEGPENKVDFLAHGWDWSKLGDGTVVDLGGNVGYAAAALAKHHPSLKFVVQDLPHIVDKVDKDVLPEDVRDRLSFMAHDFFTPQPVHGADVYLFRWIFHNWPDKYAVMILQNLVPALKKGAKVLINEGLLSDPSLKVDSFQERIMRTLDLTMLTTVNAKSRESDIWSGIFARADPRFRYLGASKAKGSLLWAIEAVWDPDGDIEATNGAIDPEAMQH